MAPCRRQENNKEGDIEVFMPEWAASTCAWRRNQEQQPVPWQRSPERAVLLRATSSVSRPLSTNNNKNQLP
jgi:hypothetical protein